MNRHVKSGICIGVALIFIWAAPTPVQAQDGAVSAQSIAERINKAKFLGRNLLEITISETCDILLKEYQAKCPDQRSEISFNLTLTKSVADDYSGALLVRSIDRTKIIRQRHYYRGENPRGRRFCAAPEGSTLKYEDKMVNDKALFYSDDQALLVELEDDLNTLGASCRE
jgi:hypothetical protein